MRANPKILTALALVAALLFPANPVGAASASTLALPGTFRDMLVDPANGNLYVAAGEEVIGYEADGTRIGSVTGQFLGSGLVLDGGELYVALGGQGTISRIAVPAMTLEASWDIDRPILETMAMDGGLLWFGHARGSGEGVGSLDPVTGEVTLDRIAPRSYPLLRTTPSQPGMVFVGARGVSPTRIEKWDVSVNPAVQVAVTSRDIGSNLGDFRFEPGGARLSVASGAPYFFSVADADDLHVTGLFYAGSSYPLAIAYSADGRVHAGGTNSSYGPDVWIHAAGQNPALLELEAGFQVARRGLALAPDGLTAYAAQSNGSGLRILPLSIEATPPTEPVRIGADGSFSLSGDRLQQVREVRVNDIPVQFTAFTSSIDIAVPEGLTAGSHAVVLESPIDEFEVPVAFTPQLVPGVAVIDEGDEGTSVVDVPVSLSVVSPETVSVDWSTVEFPGLIPGVDFEPASGTVTFPPGETTATVPVTILGDLIDEDAVYGSELGGVAFASPTNAWLASDAPPSYFLVRDDDPTPTVTGGAGFALEGDRNSTTIDVPVRLSNPSSQTVAVSWATVDAGQPEAGIDYESASGVVTFEPGETTTTISVTVFGDREEESGSTFGAEWIEIALSDPVAAIIGGSGFALIVDDDARGPRPR